MTKKTEWITSKEAARRTRYSYRHIWTLGSRGKIRRKEIAPGRYLYEWRSIQAYIRTDPRPGPVKRK